VAVPSVCVDCSLLWYSSIEVRCELNAGLWGESESEYARHRTSSMQLVDRVSIGRCDRLVRWSYTPSTATGACRYRRPERVDRIVPNVLRVPTADNGRLPGTGRSDRVDDTWWSGVVHTLPRCHGVSSVPRRRRRRRRYWCCACVSGMTTAMLGVRRVITSTTAKPVLVTSLISSLRHASHESYFSNGWLTQKSLSTSAYYFIDLPKRKTLQMVTLSIVERFSKKIHLESWLNLLQDTCNILYYAALLIVSLVWNLFYRA